MTRWGSCQLDLEDAPHLPEQYWTAKNANYVWCPQCRETKADTLNQQRPIGEGDQELEKSLDQEELI
jgi:hypothetical protein